MPERIITDSRGRRWDVSQQGSGQAVFRHQSGSELHGRLPADLNAMSTEDLLDALDEARREAGQRDVGHGGLDVSTDEDGYETGR